MSFIVLDYDETYTRFPALFDKLIENAKEYGIDIFICTARQDDGRNEDVEATAFEHGIEIVYAGFNSKWKAIEKAGYIAENAIWIDDTPKAIECLNWG